MTDTTPEHEAQPNRAARRATTLLFRFELMVGDVKLRCSTTPGDIRRVRRLLESEGLPSLDEITSRDARGADAIEFLQLMAWLAVRHEEEFTDIELEAFLDDLAEIVVLKDEGVDRLRPTPAGPPNA